MFSQGGAHPQNAAAAGPTNEGAAVTQQCTKKNCMNLNKVYEKAIQQRRQYRDELEKHDRKEYWKHIKSNGLHEMEQAIKLYLAGCLADKPVPDLDVKFDEWRRPNDELTLHERLYYGFSCHKSMDMMKSKRMYRCHTEYNHGIEFLHDLVSKDFPIERRVPVFMKLRKASSEVDCENHHCKEWSIYGKQLADKLRKEEREYRDYTMGEKNRDSVLEGRALIYALKMLICVHRRRRGASDVIKNLREKILNKKTKDEERKKKDQSPPIPNTLKKNGLYKEAVRCVRALLWHAGLPSDQHGKEFLEYVKSRDPVEIDDYGRRLRPDSFDWVQYRNDILFNLKFNPKKSDVLPSEPRVEERLYWKVDHLELTEAKLKEEEEKRKKKKLRLEKKMGSEEWMNQKLQQAQIFNQPYISIDEYYELYSKIWINSLPEKEKNQNRRRDDGDSSNETNETSPDNEPRRKNKK